MVMAKKKRTLTAKTKIVPSVEQADMLRVTAHACRDACNAVSAVIFQENTLVQAKLHKLTYRELRSTLGLKSQMAQSVLKTVIAKYKTNHIDTPPLKGQALHLAV